MLFPRALALSLLVSAAAAAAPAYTLTRESFAAKTKTQQATVVVVGSLAPVARELTETWFERRYPRARAFVVTWQLDGDRWPLQRREWTRGTKACAAAFDPVTEKFDACR